MRLVDLVPAAVTPGHASLLDEHVARLALTLGERVVGVGLRFGRVLLGGRVIPRMPRAVPRLAWCVAVEAPTPDAPAELVAALAHGGLHRRRRKIYGDAPTVVRRSRPRGQRAPPARVEIPEVLLIGVRPVGSPNRG